MSDIQGPILILGARGFIGSNLYRKLRESRTDVYPDRAETDSVRLDLTKHARAVIEFYKPATIFDCVTYGGYLNQDDVPRIYDTNVKLKAELLSLAHGHGCTYIHGGSSSEYGVVLNAPPEDTTPRPHTHYAVSKYAASCLIHMYGKHRGMRCCNLRFYSVYGPGEREENRLIPQLIKGAKDRKYPPFVHASITRDYIHVEDVCEAYIAAAASLKPEHYGESFNIGTGKATSMFQLALLAKYIFDLPGRPVFSSMPDREYDFRGTWRANPEKALTGLGWKAKISLREGLERAKSN